MIEIDLLWLLIASELFLVLVVMLAGLAFIALRRRRRDRQAARDLVRMIKDAEPQRVALLRERLQQAGHLEETLEQDLRTILQAEKSFCQRIINLYIRRDASALRNLHKDVIALGESLLEVGVSAGGDTPTATAESGASEELAQLRTEHEALQRELQVTMETMSQMLNDYAAAFGGDLDAMESQTFKDMLSKSQAEEAEDTTTDSSGESDGEKESESLFPSSGGDLSDLEEINSSDLDLSWNNTEQVATTLLDQIPEESGEEEIKRGQPEQEDRIDLADDTLAGVEGHTPPPDMNEDLADIWATALDEQEGSEDPRRPDR